MTAERPPAITRSRSRSRLFLGLGLAAIPVIAAGLIYLRQPAEGYTPGADAGAAQEITSRLAREIPENAPRIQFTDAAAEAGLEFTHFHGSRSTQLPEDMGSGAAWGDYDDDGDPDLYLVNISGPLSDGPEELQASPATSSLFRNDGGSFTDVTEEAGVGIRSTGMGAAWGDYDGDGDLDLLVTSFGRNTLFRNDGDGSFTDATSQAGLDAGTGFWTGASWSDYDRDGDLDLYVCGYVQYAYDEVAARKTSFQYNAVVPFTLNPSTYTPERNLLFRNDGGVFTEIAKEAGVANLSGRSLSAAWADFDGDAWPDLYVANDISDNALFRNEGDGTFRDISHASWVADYRGAMGLAVGDRDGDGDLDIFVSHWIAQENALYDNLMNVMEPTADEPMHFIDNADLVGLGQIGLDFIGWGTGLLDYDNDGRLDLFVANGSTFQVQDDPARLIPMRNLLFWNAGPKAGFYEVGSVSGPAFQRENVGRGAAFADYDLDGDIDILVVDHGGKARLLRNAGNENNWSRILLRGPAGPAAGGPPATTTFALGARITAVAGGAQQVREIGAGPSYLGQDPPGEAHFGLGRADRLDRLEITWPDGGTETFEGLPVNRRIKIVQGGGYSLVGPEAPAAAAEGGLDRGEVRQFWRLFREATRERHAGEFAKAEDLYRQALAIDPRHEDSLYYLGQSLDALGRVGEAREALRRLVEVDSGSSRGHAALGSLLAHHAGGSSAELQDAEQHFREALRINREETGPMIRLAEVLILMGRLEEAGEWLEAATLTNHWSIEAPFLAGYVRWEAGDMEGAGRFHLKALEASAPRTAPEGLPGEGDRKKTAGGGVVAAPPASALGRTLFGDLAPSPSGETAQAANQPDLDRIYGRVRARARELSRS